MPGLDWATTMPDLHGKVLTLEYVAAAGEPAPCTDAFYSTFEGECQLEPILNLYPDGIMDGAVAATPTEVARGSAVPSGSAQRVEVRWTVPDDTEDVLDHDVLAGSVALFGVDVGGGAEVHLQDAAGDLQAALDPASGITDEDVKDLALLNAVSKRYFRDFADDLEEATALKHARLVRRFFGGLFQRRLLVGSGGELSRGNRNVDLHRLVVGTFLAPAGVAAP